MKDIFLLTFKMSTLKSQTLNGYSDSWTEDVTLNFLSTEEIVQKIKPIVLFSKIKESHELIFIALILVFGLVLNSIIFRCYFRVKNDIARYIRFFAIYDCFVIIISLSTRIVVLYATSQEVLKRILITTTHQCVYYSMLGPLFLALDRFLIVSFPHNFQLHEKKMRRFKVALVLLTVLLSLYYLFEATKDNFVLITIFLVNFTLQFLACVVLYVIIVVKIVTSERKMKGSRHMAKGYDERLLYN